MTPRIRIIYPRKRTSFVEKLERRARALLAKPHKAPSRFSVQSILEREIGLALNQLERQRDLHKYLRWRLLRLECYIGTEILAREPPPPVYADPRLAERDMLRARLLAIEAERRRLALLEDERLRPLEDRLLSLMNKRWQTAAN